MGRTDRETDRLRDGQMQRWLDKPTNGGTDRPSQRCKDASKMQHNHGLFECNLYHSDSIFSNKLQRKNNNEKDQRSIIILKKIHSLNLDLWLQQLLARMLLQMPSSWGSQGHLIHFWYHNNLPGRVQENLNLNNQCQVVPRTNHVRDDITVKMI